MIAATAKVMPNIEVVCLKNRLAYMRTQNCNYWATPRWITDPPGSLSYHPRCTARPVNPAGFVRFKQTLAIWLPGPITASALAPSFRLSKVNSRDRLDRSRAIAFRHRYST